LLAEKSCIKNTTYQRTKFCFSLFNFNISTNILFLSKFKLQTKTKRQASIFCSFDATKLLNEQIQKMKNRRTTTCE